MISITIIVDDRAGPGLLAEHGLALWIEAAGKRILFDTGQGVVLLNNAHKLGIDLSCTDTIVLSHGHYDHTGGLAAVLALAPGAKVYCHASAVEERYSIGEGVARPVGMPGVSRAALRHLPQKQQCFVEKPLAIAPGIGVTGYIPRRNIFEDVGGSFFLDASGESPDEIKDDLALWIETPSGLLVVTGCAHAGLINTIEYIARLNQGLKISVIIGGFHLSKASRDRLERTVAGLKLFFPEQVAAGHCSGEKIVEKLRQGLGAGVNLFCSGVRMEI